VDAIAAYRRDESGDAALALDVGFEIVEVLKRNKKLSLDEKVEAVRDAIDQMLRRRNYS
jgi:predicted RecB family endonuclease